MTDDDDDGAGADAGATAGAGADGVGTGMFWIPKRDACCCPPSSNAAELELARWDPEGWERRVYGPDGALKVGWRATGGRILVCGGGGALAPVV